MSDDTRDMAIRTATLLEKLTEKVDTLQETVTALHSDLNERRGAEKFARALHTIFGGAVGAAVVKGVTWMGLFPK